MNLEALTTSKSPGDGIRCKFGIQACSICPSMWLCVCFQAFGSVSFSSLYGHFTLRLFKLIEIIKDCLDSKAGESSCGSHLCVLLVTVSCGFQAYHRLVSRKTAPAPNMIRSIMEC